MAKVNTTTLLLLGTGAVAVWYFTKNSGGSRQDKIQYLTGWVNQQADQPEDKQRFIQILSTMTDQEITDTYTFIHDYVLNNRQVPSGSDLQGRIQAISYKYNIFT